MEGVRLILITDFTVMVNGLQGERWNRWLSGTKTNLTAPSPDVMKLLQIALQNVMLGGSYWERERCNILLSPHAIDEGTVPSDRLSADRAFGKGRTIDLQLSSQSGLP